ncbi:MAG TPA: gamma-glutamylcyclotransferase family protein [Gemmatimonadaceae bacterium]|nr:gamma-glutamylcyclotransferase family protein [Gemmatimonadaceae bacterium]
MSAVRLFVYGSLRRDSEGKTHPLLADALFLGPATVAGALYRVDWYPGLVLGADGTVHGELYELPLAKVDHMLTSLDDYEGGGFRRRKATVQADGVAHADAWVYIYIGPTHALSAIATGDYGPPEHRARP